jgi:hypothetical protein
MKNVIIGRLIVLMAALLAAPAEAQAQDTQDYDYETNADNTITITLYTGTNAVVAIPAEITGLPVTCIGSNAFSSLAKLTGVTIPGSVNSIGDSAFWACTSLTKLSIANGVASIGDTAFYECITLTCVTIPSSVTNIGAGAFGECGSLTNATIGGGVLSIGENAFTLCRKLTAVYFQGNAPSAGWSVFNSLTGPDDPATIYYLPGTTGWGDFSTSTGHPALLWNPLIQTGDGSFGVRNNQFGFNITGTTNIPIVVEASTSLAGPVWTPLQSLTLTNGSYYFSEPFQPGSPGRFYRITSQ